MAPERCRQDDSSQLATVVSAFLLLLQTVFISPIVHGTGSTI